MLCKTLSNWKVLYFSLVFPARQKFVGLHAIENRLRAPALHKNNQR
jgi:hypothetical protein